MPISEKSVLEGIYDIVLTSAQVLRAAAASPRRKLGILRALPTLGPCRGERPITKQGKLTKIPLDIERSCPVNVQGPWPKATAINEFTKQFKSKTNASWSGRKTMTPKAGEINLLHHMQRLSHDMSLIREVCLDRYAYQLSLLRASSILTHISSERDFGDDDNKKDDEAELTTGDSSKGKQKEKASEPLPVPEPTAPPEVQVRLYP